MVKQKIFIRVDGSPEIGLGHLIRSIALAEMVSSDFDVIFVSKKIPNKYYNELKENFEVEKIQSEEDFFLIVHKSSIVVTDGYDFKPAFFEKMKNYCSRIVSIQDIQHYSRNIDLIINHLPESETFYSGCNVLAGPKYAIVRKEFLRTFTSLNLDQKDEIFISLGGTNNYKYINKLIEFLSVLRNPFRLNILTTGNNKPFIEKRTNCCIFTDLDAVDIVKLVDAAKLCVVTPGMISYEVLARNREVVVVSLNEGQEMAAQKFAELNLVENMGPLEKLTKEKLLKALKRRNINKCKVEKIFDGNSGRRILQNLKTLSNS